MQQPDTLTRDDHRTQLVYDELGLHREISRDALIGYSEALLSDDGKYRYLLTRRWAIGGKTCTFVMLNPATATAYVRDNTDIRCVGYARLWGYSAMNVVNIYGYMATDPREMFRADDPIGPHNDRLLADICTPGWLTVAAWGIHGKRNGRGAQVAEMLAGLGVDLSCLEYTSGGAPRHPLFCRLGLVPQPYEAR